MNIKSKLMDIKKAQFRILSISARYSSVDTN